MTPTSTSSSGASSSSVFPPASTGSNSPPPPRTTGRHSSGPSAGLAIRRRSTSCRRAVSSSQRSEAAGYVVSSGDDLDIFESTLQDPTPGPTRVGPSGEYPRPLLRNGGDRASSIFDACRTLANGAPETCARRIRNRFELRGRGRGRLDGSGSIRRPRSLQAAGRADRWRPKPAERPEDAGRPGPPSATSAAGPSPPSTTPTRTPPRPGAKELKAKGRTAPLRPVETRSRWNSDRPPTSAARIAARP